MNPYARVKGRGGNKGLGTTSTRSPDQYKIISLNPELELKLNCKSAFWRINGKKASDCFRILP